MPSVLIVYGSSKGRTGRIAKIISDHIEQAGLSVELKNVFETQPENLLLYRYIVLGSSTYGQGDLQQDFWNFERGMDSLDLSGIRAAVFGSGNSRYSFFAEAVDILEAKVRILGARLLIPSLRQNMMEESPEDNRIHTWAADLAASILADKAVSEDKIQKA